jgi:hypothetical protein
MTQAQQYRTAATLGSTLHWRAPGAGELVARDLPLWLTREGDLDDHVLQPGQSLRLRRGDDVVIEALRRAVPPAWDWVPAQGVHASTGQPPRRPEGLLGRLAAWAARLGRTAGGSAVSACAARDPLRA